MQRVLTIVVPIIIGFAVIGFFVFGLMQRPDIVPNADVSAPVVIDTDEQADATVEADAAGEAKTKTTENAGADSATASNAPQADNPTAAAVDSTVVDVAEPSEEAAIESTAVSTSTLTAAPAANAATGTITETIAETGTETVSVPIQVVNKPVEFGYELIATYPHDRKAFTQGLVWEDGVWYEGTGLRGESTLRKVDPATGDVLQKIDLDDSLFGEGITIFDDKIYQLTWQARRGFVYEKESFELLEEFTYPTEGWGITHDGERLIMSDGTETIYFWDPVTLEQSGSITVTNRGQPVKNLNELEYIDGLIYANIWQTPFIVLINPDTGVVEGMLKLDDLLTPADLTEPVNVLNGIAYDHEAERLFVTGKLWPKIFEIRLVSPLP